MIEVLGNQIASSKITIKNCFADDMWFSIPHYQRPFVWGKEQIHSLLDDIYYAAEHTSDSQYFLGSLVLHCFDKKEESSELSYRECAVLDGQQRLTTLYLLYAVMRDLSHNPDVKELCSKVIYQKGNKFNSSPERMRIDFSIREDVKAFAHDFLKTDGQAINFEEQEKDIKKKSLSVQNMSHALKIIKEWLEQGEESLLEDLLVYLNNKVILVYVASDELDDAYRLFTVLNDRGIRLRSSDIIKANNLQELPDEAKRKHYAKEWETLENSLEEDFDKFLSYVRTIFVKEKARNTLLKEFEDNIFSPQKYDKDSRSYIKKAPLLKKGKEAFDAILSYKQHYDQIFSGDNYKLTNSFAFDNLISVLSDTAISDIWVPPLMSYRKHFGDEGIYEFLVKLDNKFSVSWVCGATPTTRLGEMNKVLKKIERCAARGNPEKLLKSHCLTYNEVAFIQAINSSDLYKKRYARYLLRKVDFLLDDPKHTQQRTAYKKMSIEHILPRNPKKDSQWVRHFDEASRADWTNCLGNLVLLSRNKNSSQGNLDFLDKKNKYFQKHIETFPNSLKVMEKEAWDMAALETHHEFLCELIQDYYAI